MSEAALQDTFEHPIHGVLRRVLEDNTGVSGVLVATTEGMLVAAEFTAAGQASAGPHAEAVAAMSSAAVGLGLQFTHRLGLGRSTACVVQGNGGCVGVQRVGARGVLVLFGDGLNMAHLNVAVRRAMPSVHEILVDMGV